MTEHHIVVFDGGTIGDDIVWPDFSALGKLTIHDHSTPEQALERIKDATIALTNKVYITKEMINAAPDLVYIGTLATGYNQVDTETAARRSIPVCNVPDYSTNAVAQHTFALILALAGGICDHAAAVAQGEWTRSRHFSFWHKPVFELDGKTLGIVGFGNTGKAVAALGHCFGMHILAYAPRPKPAPSYAPFAFTTLDEIFTRSDVVSLHCPLTPENTGLVNSARLAAMKKSALLINCSRGPLVDSGDLALALREGVIAGAGLDVIPVEPMPENDPLLDVPNCLVTPHIAWASTEARTRLMNMVFDNVKAFLEGKPTNVQNGL